jgi:hypothetical protein
MAPFSSTDPTTVLDPVRSLRPWGPRVIGYDRDGAAIWASAGGRGLGIEFAVDDKDGDEADDFDGDDEDDDEGTEYDIEDRDDDEDDDEADDEDDDGEPRARRRQREAEGRWEPPTQSEWERLQEAQKRNNGELARNREARKILKRLGLKDASEFANFLIDRGIDPDNGDLLDNARKAENADTEGHRAETIAQHRRAEQRGAERESARWRPAVVQWAAADAFRDAGFSGGNLSRVLRLLDVDSVDVEFDDGGDVVVYGLDEQVKTIVEDLPQLFKPRGEPARESGREPGRRRREGAAAEEPHRRRESGRRVAAGGVRQVDGGERPRPGPKKLGWLEKTDRAMRGLTPEPRGRR